MYPGCLHRVCALQLGLHPLFQRLQGLRDAKVFHKGGEVADALRERWETSDSPVVHKIQVRPSQRCKLELAAFVVPAPPERLIAVLGLCY